MLIFDGAPEPFHKSVVEDSATTVHAHPYAGPFQWNRKLLRRELATLVGVEDLGPAEPEGVIATI